MSNCQENVRRDKNTRPRNDVSLSSTIINAVDHSGSSCGLPLVLNMLEVQTTVNNSTIIFLSVFFFR